MRTTLTCPKCKNCRILLVQRVPDTGEYTSEIRDLHVAVTKRKSSSWLTPDSEEGVGKLTAAVCRACGYTEFYTKSPELIPVDGVNVREVVGPMGGAYRE